MWLANYASALNSSWIDECSKVAGECKFRLKSTFMLRSRKNNFRTVEMRPLNSGNIKHHHTPLQDHICTVCRCCCCPLLFCHCVWCLPQDDQGGTAALQLQQGARHKGSPLGMSESETSLWKTAEWSDLLPSRRSSDREKGRETMWQTSNDRLVSFNHMTHFKERISSACLPDWVSVWYGRWETRRQSRGVFEWLYYYLKT